MGIKTFNYILYVTITYKIIISTIRKYNNNKIYNNIIIFPYC